MDSPSGSGVFIDDDDFDSRWQFMKFRANHRTHCAPTHTLFFKRAHTHTHTNLVEALLAHTHTHTGARFSLAQGLLAAAATVDLVADQWGALLLTLFTLCGVRDRDAKKTPLQIVDTRNALLSL